jgi:hypothetical protein
MEKEFSQLKSDYAKLNLKLESERVKNTGRRRDDNEEV